jgi:hypothetical protein
VTLVVPMFSPETYETIGTPHGTYEIQIVNMMGFRISNEDIDSTATPGARSLESRGPFTPDLRWERGVVRPNHTTGALTAPRRPNAEHGN